MSIGAFLSLGYIGVVSRRASAPFNSISVALNPALYSKELAELVVVSSYDSHPRHFLTKTVNFGVYSEASSRIHLQSYHNSLLGGNIVLF